MDIAVIGAGALGTRLLPALLKLPVARIIIIDGDFVEAANLDRQPLYAPIDIGSHKAIAAVERLRAITTMALDAKPFFFNASNAQALIGTCHIVADCTDDLHAKGAIDRACAQLGLPLVSGALHADQGQVITFQDSLSGRPSRAELFAGRIGPEQDGCDMRMVLSLVMDAVADRMASTIAGLVGGNNATSNAIQVFDGRAGEWIIFQPAVHDHG